MTLKKDTEKKYARIDRRTMLKLMAATGTYTGLMGGMSFAQGSEAGIELEDPSYEAVFNNVSGYYMQDEQWVRETLPRLTWPEAGQPVPELRVVINNGQPDALDAFRKWSTDSAQIGLRYTIEQASPARWLELINKHQHGDIQLHPSILRPERVDPAEWLVSRAYGGDRRNYGEWVNKEYDRLVDLQTQESDGQKRLEYVQEAQSVLCDDYYIAQLGWGPSIIEAYNEAEWDGVVSVQGFGIANLNGFHTFLQLEPKTSRRSVRVGMTDLLETTNMLGASNNMRSIGRMIYDRLAYFDENLNTIPWALESWEQVDERTWDVKLRPGMEFHDGEPVTVNDLQFTFDFMRKYERGIYWTANRFLESTEILDENGGIVRIRFTEPYSQFESYFLQLNIILPQHIWDGIMEAQNAGDDPRRLRIETPIGSGPFSFGRHRRDTELQLIANKKHFSSPNIDEMWIVATPSLDSLLGRLESGELDFIESSKVMLTPSQAAQFASVGHVNVVTTEDINWFHAVVRVSWLPWRDIEFRRAWQHSIDREFLVNVPWEGAGRVPRTNSFLVDGNPWTNPDLPEVPAFDLEKARQILQEAGYSWDNDGRLLYPSADDQAFRERVTAVCKPGYAWGGLKMLPQQS